jgi:hypothetical protein
MNVLIFRIVNSLLLPYSFFRAVIGLSVDALQAG